VEIDRFSDVPPYQQVAGWLRERIESGELEPGSRLPGVEHLVQEFGIARTTSRKALRLLRDQGLARVTQGTGTYVAPREDWPDQP
jgi:DNA-binding GntR family transcriptional regulator